MKTLYKGFIKFIACDNIIRLLHKRFVKAAPAIKFRYEVDRLVEEPYLIVYPKSNEFTESFDEAYDWLIPMTQHISDICDEPIFALAFDRIAKELAIKDARRTIHVDIYDGHMFIESGYERKDEADNVEVVQVKINTKKEVENGHHFVTNSYRR